MYKELSHFLFKPNQRVEAAAPHCSDSFISLERTWQFAFLSQLQTLFIQLPGENLGEKPHRGDESAFQFLGASKQSFTRWQGKKETYLEEKW